VCEPPADDVGDDPVDQVEDDPLDRVEDDPLARVFPGDDGVEDGVGSVPGVDERRQRLLDPLGDPDREAW
jgi:hypothetical protein